MGKSVANNLKSQMYLIVLSKSSENVKIYLINIQVKPAYIPSFFSFLLIIFHFIFLSYKSLEIRSDDFQIRAGRGNRDFEPIKEIMHLSYLFIGSYFI